MGHGASIPGWLRSAAFLFAVAALGATQAACFALTTKMRVGPTVDVDGNAAVQADLAFGFGYSFSTDTALTASLGVGTGSRNHLELTDTIEYHRMDDDYGWRAGVRSDIGLVGDKAMGGWIHGAFLIPIKKTHRSGGHEKSFQTRDATRWSVGFEGRFGYLSHEVADDDVKTAAAFGVAATLEWHGFARMR